MKCKLIEGDVVGSRERERERESRGLAKKNFIILFRDQNA
jgi:hypothetical protein